VCVTVSACARISECADIHLTLQYINDELLMIYRLSLVYRYTTMYWRHNSVLTCGIKCRDC
jgi:hypothetical protein